MQVNRRHFLGGLFATSALPNWGADNPALFPKRGRYERLALTCQHVKIGLEKPFSLLHISDTHLTAVKESESDLMERVAKQRTQTFGGRQEEALRDSLAWAKKNVHYVLHTGDLMDWQSEANLELAQKYFPLATMACLGNHEYSRDLNFGPTKEEKGEAWKALTREKVQAACTFDTELASTVVNGVNFVTLDDVYGYVTAHQVERFNEEVKKGLPLVLCMHVPFYAPDIARAARKYWAGVDKPDVTARAPAPFGDFAKQQQDVVTRKFIADLKNQPLLKCILSGHLHLSVQARFSRTAIQYVVGGNFLFHGQQVIFT